MMGFGGWGGRFKIEGFEIRFFFVGCVCCEIRIFC